jgi:hypothetical protein
MKKSAILVGGIGLITVIIIIIISRNEPALRSYFASAPAPTSAPAPAYTKEDGFYMLKDKNNKLLDSSDPRQAYGWERRSVAKADGLGFADPFGQTTNDYYTEEEAISEAKNTCNGNKTCTGFVCSISTNFYPGGVEGGYENAVINTTSQKYADSVWGKRKTIPKNAPCKFYNFKKYPSGYVVFGNHFNGIKYTDGAYAQVPQVNDGKCSTWFKYRCVTTRLPVFSDNPDTVHNPGSDGKNWTTYQKIQPQT